MDKVYNSEITRTDDIYIYGHGDVTSDVEIAYSVSNEGDDSEIYTNISRKVVLKNEDGTAIIPAGTSIVLEYDGTYYFYNVTEDKTEISLTEFTDLSGKSFSEVTDITSADGVETEENEITGLVYYTYSEEYRVIFDFTNSSSQVASGTYYGALQVYYDGEWLESESTDKPTNNIHIYNREYSYNYTLSKEAYINKETIYVNGTVTLGSTENEMEQAQKDLYAKISLIDENGASIDIPEGAVVTINDSTGTSWGGSSYALLYENLQNDELSIDLHFSIDMESVLPQNRLTAGTYNIVVDFVLAYEDMIENTVQAEETVSVPIIVYDPSEYGLSATIDISDDSNVQLIENGVEASKTVTLSYNGNIDGANVVITKMERTGEFTYEETTNADEISISEGSSITSLESTQDITINFSSSIETGTYRIYFELYDSYGNKITEDFVGFIVY